MVEEGPRCYRFACNTCPYVQNIERTVSIKYIKFYIRRYNLALILSPAGFLQVSYFKES